MRNTLSNITIAVITILALASLAFQMDFGESAQGNINDELSASPQVQPSGAEILRAHPEVELGDEYRSEQGGFSFNVIPGYAFQEDSGKASMNLPDNDEIGVLLFGGVAEERITLDSLYDQITTDIFGGEEDVKVGNKQSIRVAGLPGYYADISGTENGTPMAGRIVVVAVSPEQQFVMMGFGTKDRWDAEVEAYFEAVLATVKFFEPTEGEAGFEEPAVEEVRQWASSAAASSEYSNPSWAAMQATGEPDTLIDYCGTMDTAWASYEGYSVEWLELTYDQAVIPTEINIIQTSAPNQVAQVEVVGLDGSYRTVYIGQPEKITEGCPYTLTVSPDIDYEVNGVRIVIDQTELDYPWNEIDAVELVGYSSSSVLPEVSTEGVNWRIGGEQGFEEGQFGSMEGIDVTTDGLVYVTDSSVGVRMLNAWDGAELMTFGEDVLWNPSDLKVAPDGNVYVSDWGENMIFAFSPMGELLAQFGSEGNGSGEFGTFSPDSIAISLEGEVYALDENETDTGEAFTRIQVFDADGKYLREFPIGEDPEIEGMDFGPDGNLYAVDWFGDVILKYSPDGELLAEIGAEALYFSSPQALAIDDAGFFYVAVWSPDGVMKLDPSGNLTTQYGVEASDGETAWPEGAFYSIARIAVMANGSLVFVSDWSGSYSYVTAFELE